MITICFTGHRPNNPNMGGYYWDSPKNKKIREVLKTIIQEQLDLEYVFNRCEEHNFKFIVGGALGIDQFAFDVIQDVKYNNGKYAESCFYTEVAIPFSKQACKWVYEDVKRYEIQNSQADKLTYVDRLDNYKIKGYEEEVYYPAKMQKRNEYMVDNSDIVIAVWDGVKKGGTWNCVKYAQKLDKNIIYINPKEI